MKCASELESIKKYEKLQKSNKTYIDSEILILTISKLVFNNANYLIK